MKIERFKKNNIIMNRAVNKSDKWLFLHCSNGKSEVTTRELNKFVVPMLHMHNVISIQIIRNSKIIESLFHFNYKGE